MWNRKGCGGSGPQARRREQVPRGRGWWWCWALALLLGSEREEAVPQELCGGCEVTHTEVIGAACGRVQWWRGVGG